MVNGTDMAAVMVVVNGTDMVAVNGTDMAEVMVAVNGTDMAEVMVAANGTDMAEVMVAVNGTDMVADIGNTGNGFHAVGEYGFMDLVGLGFVGDEKRQHIAVSRLSTKSTAVFYKKFSNNILCPSFKLTTKYAN
ncbi:hypothetical protein UP17_08395 [Peribacillus simplex]|nr:hypothetical protein UP17_08395 [Peribacillus simplex]